MKTKQKKFQYTKTEHIKYAKYEMKSKISCTMHTVVTKTIDVPFDDMLRRTIVERTAFERSRVTWCFT